MRFNRASLKFGSRIEQPTFDEIKSTPQLWNAGIEDAALYGGDLTRAALSAMDIRGDYDHVVVDTKVHMLVKGMFPAIPGWHTDGVPRGDTLNPQDKGLPNIQAQEERRSPRFHLLVTGEGALTDFWGTPEDLDVPEAPNRDLYAQVSRQMNELEEIHPERIVTAPSCQVVEWDWWDLHTARAAQQFEWRFLIRVTETDEQAPQSDLRQILRTQSNVYVPTDQFGW